LGADQVGRESKRDFVEIPDNPLPAGAEFDWFEGRALEGRSVRVRVLTAPAQDGPARGTIIVAPGRTEFIEKYFEVIGELQSRGFAVFCIDWRGQGLSGREVDNSLKGHFGSFDDPVNDLATALKLYADRLPRPHIALAHSMGGAIVLRALWTRRVELDAAAFTAPMWGIAGLGKTTTSVIRFLAAVGAGGQFAPSVKQRWAPEPFKRNPVTHDEVRHARCQNLIAQEPRLALAGPTNGWIAAAADTIDAFLKPGALAHVRIPILVASAGQEALVDNASQRRVAEQLPNAKYITIEGAKHEILMERDELRVQFWTAFDEFIASVVTAPS